MDGFKVGDTVKLAGGPVMTVSQVYRDHIDNSKIKVQCQWFAGKKLENGHFPSESLTRVMLEKE